MSTLPEGDLAYDELVRTRPTTTSTYIPGVGHVGRVCLGLQLFRAVDMLQPLLLVSR